MDKVVKGMSYMYNYPHPSSNYPGVQIYDPYYFNYCYQMNPHPYWANTTIDWPNYPNQAIYLRDYGPDPFIVNIENVTKQNDFFRIALWTGEYFQLTLMSIRVGEDIGVEMHPDVDQFIRIEEGQGYILMGDTEDCLDLEGFVYEDYAIIIPAGKWHNLINVGYTPLKLYSIYAPPEHPFGTVHVTKEDAEEYHE